jgi:uncharacterized protein YpuA (DUF1002 family)
MTRSPSRSSYRPARDARTLIGLIAVLLVLSGSWAQIGSAAQKKKTQTITLGESLNDFQRTELLGVFNAAPDDRIITITMADTLEAMAGIAMTGSITSAYSSTALKCRNLGEGLDVTTSNITLVTPDLYAIALVTAGIGDATLVVAAPAAIPAQGMTAMAGIFKTWDLAPCASGDTSKERQQLALEELALAATIGSALVAAGIPDGVQRAGNVVLEAQKTIVTNKLKEPADIDAAIAAQEAAQGIFIPAEMRVQLVDLMVRLAQQKIDWSTFSAGWTIERDPTNTRITMTGDGIAIRNARQTATAEARANKTATAEAANALTATADAQAKADLTATARAQPTVTATAKPTSTPAPIGLSGTITSTDGAVMVVEPSDGGDATTYTIASGAQIRRAGTAVTSRALAKGDTVQFTVDGRSHEVIQIAAQPAPAAGRSWIDIAAFLVLLAGAAGTAIAWMRRRQDEPFIVTLAPG